MKDFLQCAGVWAFGVLGWDAVDLEYVGVADSLGSDIIHRLVGSGSNRWKRSVQEGGDGIVLDRVDLEM